MPIFPVPPKNYRPSKFHADYFLCALVLPQFSIGVLGGVANLQSRGRGTQGIGNGTTRKSVGEFLQAVHVVTFPLSLRVQIYCRFCAQACHFFAAPL